jgi:hypothetical protein
VQSLVAYLKTQKGEAASSQLDADQSREQMETTRKTLHTQIQNVVSAIRDCGHSRTLLAELNELEAKAARIDEILTIRYRNRRGRSRRKTCETF